ncbi:hypothetical protein RND71_016381 [Anisodus tanguticus]|uniref:ENT domain-containing protein n=1 Tax=Anisodus tanguticus TaxID=243964 RepID=A0AAE1S769_9SOLA|nr:hypothetical protein RND71_016381 [Anisodus tanguticus]
MNTSEVPISWRTAEIMSGNGHTCTVRYGSRLGMRSENFEERVSRKMIRPCPVVHRVETWAPGDIVEVYNDNSWKIAIVVSVLQLDCYLVRLLGCSLELSIHKSGMRDRQNWKDGKWILIRKGCVQAGAKRSNKISTQDCCQKMKSQLLPLDAPTKVLGETDGLATHGKNRGQESCIISSRSLKRMSPYYTSGVDSLYGNAQKFQAIGTDNCRRRAALAATLPEKVDVVAYPRGTVGEKYMHSSVNIRSNGFNELEREDLDGVFGFSPQRSLEPSDSDSDACSVGSCSVTSERPNKLLSHLPRISCRVSGVLCSDAESVCGSGPSGYKEKSHSNPPEEELATSVHTLELHAYKCTLVALYASGPLTWEQEALLTDLRIILHISNDEHLMELKNLISSKVAENLSRLRSLQLNLLAIFLCDGLCTSNGCFKLKSIGSLSKEPVVELLIIQKPTYSGTQFSEAHQWWEKMGHKYRDKSRIATAPADYS